MDDKARIKHLETEVEYHRTYTSFMVEVVRVVFNKDHPVDRLRELSNKLTQLRGELKYES